MSVTSAALRKRKTLKKGIQFTLMVVGQSGTGRSTFINSLCGQQVVDTSSTIPAPTDSSEDRDFHLREEQVELEDNEGVKISLSIIDTPGFGDSLDNSSSFNIITDFIKHQYDEVLVEESRVRRNPRFKDSRVHAVIYFINATGHGLKEIDIELLKQLSGLTNVIPVISKADSLTREELILNKKLILEDLKHYQIELYDFPYDLENDDTETIDTNSYLRSLIPFSVVGSNQVFEVNGELIRGRKYPWGFINIEDHELSDFVILRNLLLISHLQDLKDYTHEILYERYRTEALSGGGLPDHLQGQVNSQGGSTPSLKSPYIKQEGAESLNSVNSPALNNHNDTYLAREEQIRLEEERLKAFEERVQKDLMQKKKELMERERELREIEERLEKEAKLKQEVGTDSI
ncbi:CYFA0S20e02146g1_1 [Cyberlindnera fabianii]|uniref:CYFA0S20e02146g1_1 n=1 Tax=Cyberlindnera fabianii TaxID=36022 RepID=A0A061B7R3_CYBFA|nr:Cell division control protein 11 [Cyberlindnera fabianii]CDR45948.1 CYFA0S20e02146g1_1 [Cyberlindnera fabianii]